MNTTVEPKANTVKLCFQASETESGPAALTMILNAYRKTVSFEDCLLACPAGQGLTPEIVAAAARQFGMDAETASYSVAKLLQDGITLPAIIAPEPCRYAILVKLTPRHAIVMDPVMGEKRLTLPQLEQVLREPVIALRPGPDFKPDRHPTGFLRSIMLRIKGLHLALLFILLLGIFLVIPGMGVPAMTRIFFDNILGLELYHWLSPLLAGLLLALLIKGALTWMLGHYLSRIEATMLISSSAELFYHLLRLPMEFFRRHSPGEIMSRLNLVSPTVQLLAGKLGFNMANLVTVIFFTVLMALFDPMLTGVCLVAIIINILILTCSNRMQNKLIQENIAAKNQFSGLLGSGIQMIESIKAADMEQEYYSLLAERHAVMVNVNVRKAVILASLYATPPLLGALTSGTILVYGAFRILDGNMSIGTLIAFQLLANGLLDPINQLVAMGGQLQEGRANLSQLDDLLDSRQDKRFEQRPPRFQPSHHPTKLVGCLEFRNVTFGYNSCLPPLFENFSLRLDQGKRIALVGHSGAGKSTTALLAAGLYQPWSGEILYDGQPRNNIPACVYDNSVAIVTQNIRLFSGTVLDNLTMWDTTIPERNVLQAAGDAEIHNDITRKQYAYSGFIEEDGANFSGGQRQRLEIARALVRNPSLLILDEATSALDPEIEAKIDANIRKRGCTCLIISQRLSTIRDCDEIIVLDHGKIVERGCHETLFAAKGEYYRMVNMP